MSSPSSVTELTRNNTDDFVKAKLQQFLWLSYKNNIFFAKEAFSIQRLYIQHLLTFSKVGCYDIGFC